MNIFIRVDSSLLMGTGHLMRCLTLAKQIKTQINAQIIFICRELKGNINYIVKKNGFEILELPLLTSKYDLSGYEKWLTITQEEDAEETKKILKNYNVDIIIVDSYALDLKWETIIRPYVGRIMVIDDLANRKHDCDILLDQNYYRNMGIRYAELVPQTCHRLLGPQYLLLRDEFYIAKSNLIERTGKVNNILVSLGGIDYDNITYKILLMIADLVTNEINITVVVGLQNPNKKKIKQFCETNYNFKYLCQVNNMAELIAEADLAIGAGGTTTWERCFLELPSIIIILAENQRELTEQASKENIIYSYFDTNKLDGEKFQETFVECLTMRNKVKRISDKCRKFMPTIKPNWQKILLGADT